MNKIKNFNIYKIPGIGKNGFLKITLDDGTFGFADCTDSNGSVQGTISTLKMFCNQIIGMNPMYTEMININYSEDLGKVQEALSLKHYQEF